MDTGEYTTLLPKEVGSQFNSIVRALQSGDWSFVLLGYDGQKVVGNAAEARYAVYNVQDNTTVDIGNGERLQLARWGPGNSLAYVYENDIYYLSEPTAEPMRVTTDGVPGAVYNGIRSNYGHLAESTSTSVGKSGKLVWSPDGSQIAFAQYDASAVHTTSFEFYHAPGGARYLYAESMNFRYAKPGTPIASVRLRLATLPSNTSASVTFQELLAPVDVVGDDHYLDSMLWTDDNILMAIWTNRVQNISQFVSYNTSEEVEHLSGQMGLKLEAKHGWVDNQFIMPGYGNSSTYLTIDWEPQGEAGSFLHVVKVTGTSRTPITSGEFTVTDLYGWDADGVVYYQATERGQPSSRHVYAVQEGDSPRCLSCDVNTTEGNACQRASADFSLGFSWFLLTCLGPDPAVVSLHYTANFTGIGHDVIHNWELRESLSHKQLPRRLDDWVDVGDGMRAQVRMWIPPGLDLEGSEKRPAIVHVYGGPNFQEIDDSFAVGLHSYFTTSRRYVYVLIDGRGSGCKGDRMLFSVYHRLGSVEVQDQIDVTKRLTEKYRFIDSSRVAIWGWSYGGYATAMALARDKGDVFSCGVSVAPVASWRFYNARYSERYMGLPKDNEAGYIAADVTELADRFANKTFLLIHGTADDNVLYQHSMLLARTLEEAGVLFSQQSYPDEYHWMGGLKTHLYRTIDAFFLDCFDKQSPSSAVKTPQSSSSAVKTTQSQSFTETTSEFTSSTVKASESPTSAEKTSASTTSAENTSESTFSAVKTSESPSSAVRITQSPSSAVKTNHSAFSDVKTTQPPSAAVKTTQTPFSAVKTSESPSSAVKTSASPTSAEKTYESTFSAVKTSESSSSVVSTTHSPSSIVKTTHSAFSDMKTTQSPLAAVKTTETPSSAVKITGRLMVVVATVFAIQHVL